MQNAVCGPAALVFLEEITQNEMFQAQKDKYCMISLHVESNGTKCIETEWNGEYQELE